MFLYTLSSIAYSLMITFNRNYPKNRVHIVHYNDGDDGDRKLKVSATPLSQH
jgi:hypothetical protein